MCEKQRNGIATTKTMENNITNKGIVRTELKQCFVCSFFILSLESIENVKAFFDAGYGECRVCSV